MDSRTCLEALEKTEICFTCRYQWLNLREGFNIEQKLKEYNSFEGSWQYPGFGYIS
jgi:hypothetical protein